MLPKPFSFQPVTLAQGGSASGSLAGFHDSPKWIHIPAASEEQHINLEHQFLLTGFHEAVSEAISLSVSNPRHMQTLGLVLTSVDDIPHNINFLFHLAMDKLTFLPFSLALDMWRWDIFSGYTRKERYNCHWWDLRWGSTTDFILLYYKCPLLQPNIRWLDEESIYKWGKIK